MKIKDALSGLVKFIRVVADWIESHSDSLSFVLTAGALLVGYYLLIETRRSVDLASGTFQWQRQSDSVNSISQRRKDSLFTLSQERRDSLARGVSRDDLRAYFAIDVKKPYLRVGQPYGVNVEFKNVGKTPAYELRIGHVTRFGTAVYAFDIDTLEKHIVKTDLAISPGWSYTAYLNSAPRIYKAEDSIAIYTSRQFKLNAWGKLLFKDKFGREHFINFCYWYDTETGQFMIYNHHNNAD